MKLTLGSCLERSWVRGWIQPIVTQPYDNVDLSPVIQGVPLATEPGISLIILTPMKILQLNLNSSTFFSFTFLTQ